MFFVHSFVLLFHCVIDSRRCGLNARFFSTFDCVVLLPTNERTNEQKTQMNVHAIKNGHWRDMRVPHFDWMAHAEFTRFFIMRMVRSFFFVVRLLLRVLSRGIFENGENSTRVPLGFRFNARTNTSQSNSVFDPLTVVTSRIGCVFLLFWDGIFWRARVIKNGSSWNGTDFPSDSHFPFILLDFFNSQDLGLECLSFEFWKTNWLTQCDSCLLVPSYHFIFIRSKHPLLRCDILPWQFCHFISATGWEKSNLIKSRERKISNSPWKRKDFLCLFVFVFEPLRNVLRCVFCMCDSRKKRARIYLMKIFVQLHNIHFRSPSHSEHIYCRSK